MLKKIKLKSKWKLKWYMEYFSDLQEHAELNMTQFKC